MEDKYYNFDPYKEDIIRNSEYILDTADDEFISHNLEQYLLAMEIHNANQRRIRKSQIEKRRLNKIHEQKLKRTGIIGFLAGTALAACISCAKPQFVGGEEIANEVYQIMIDEGYGWNNYENGWVFNHGTEYVSYEDAISGIRYACKSAGLSDAEIDVGLSKIIHATPTNSTLEERNAAKKDKYYESKTEEKGMGK